MPATGNFILDKGYDAAAALVKYRFCKFSAEETVTPVAAITDVVAGVPQFDVSTAEVAKGKGASVRVAGISEVECSAAITVGALVELVADGRVRTATASSGARIVGRCTKGTANAGERASVELDMTGGLVGATF